MQAAINGTHLFYTTLGQGRPILTMHGGLGFDHTQFRPWLDPLGDQATLIFYDQRGQGQSDRLDSFEGVTHETLVDDADALRAQLGYERVILLGHSYGGFLAQDYALRHGDHLAGLILVDTAPVVNYPDVIVGNAQARGTPAQFQAAVQGLSAPAASDEEFRQIWKTILPLYFHKYDPAIGAAMDAQTRYTAAAYNQGSAHGLPAFNTLPRLDEITVPTLVLGGRYDWITPPEYGAERLRAGIPNSELVIFEESGHYPFIEEPEKFQAAVTAWLARLA
jgi:proline iminopeptidase